jgi:hypothetical protein
MARVARGVMAAFLVALCGQVASASAATTVGQLFAPTTNCGTDETRFQVGVADGTSYSVPSDGVITSWSFQDGPGGGVDPAVGLKFKVARPTTPPSATIVGESDGGTQTAGAVNTRSARIPVKAGDVIGIYYQSGGCERGSGPAGDQYADIDGDQAVGSTSSYTILSGGRIPVQAKVEPDADGDGFGDETQDQCLGTPGANQGCPDKPPPPPLHGTATFVQCNYVVATSTDTCTAGVADAAGSGLSTPTGQMTFTADGGVFLVGQNCNLQPTPFAGISSCSVQYLPATVQAFPHVSATYPGDSNHSGSSGETQFEVPGSVSGLAEPTASPGQFPNEVDMTLNLPPGGVDLLACACSTNATTSGARSFSLADLIVDPNAAAATHVAQLQNFVALLNGTSMNVVKTLTATPSAAATGQLTQLSSQINDLLSAVTASRDVLLLQAQSLEDAGQATEAAQLRQQVRQQIAQANQLINRILKAQDDSCRGVIKNTQKTLVTASLVPKRKARRHLLVLGSVVRRNVGPGRTVLHLHLNRKRLSRLVGKRKKVTIAVRLFVTLPSGVFRNGVPVTTVRRITLRRGAKKH